MRAQDTGGRSFLSDQLSGATLVNHQLVTSINVGLQITPKLSFGADYILVNQWHYAPTERVRQYRHRLRGPVWTSAWRLPHRQLHRRRHVVPGLVRLRALRRADPLSRLLQPDERARPGRPAARLWGQDNIWWSFSGARASSSTSSPTWTTSTSGRPGRRRKRRRWENREDCDDGEVVHGILRWVCEPTRRRLQAHRVIWGMAPRLVLYL